METVFYDALIAADPSHVYDCDYSFTTPRHWPSTIADYVRVTRGAEEARRVYEEHVRAEEESVRKLHEKCPPARDLPPDPWYSISWENEHVREFLLKYPWPRCVERYYCSARAALGDTFYDWSAEAAGVANKLFLIYRTGASRLLEEAAYLIEALTNDTYVARVVDVVQEYMKQFREVFDLESYEDEEE